VQQNQDIKGFTLLELLVVITIVVIISAVGYPKFSSWKKDRDVRVASENIANMINGIVSQSKRGSFPFVQLHVTAKADGTGDKIFETRGMSQSKFVKKRATLLNSCPKETDNWDKLKVHTYNADVKVNISGEGTVCFSKDTTFYYADYKLDKKDYIILCHQTEDKSLDPPEAPRNQCKEKPEKPAYKVEWNRFGGVTQYKWSGSGWTNL